jgi:hypothetical protein
MIEKKRTLLFLLTVLATAAIFLLASGLPSLDLDYESQRLPTMPKEQGGGDGSARSGGLLQVAVQVFFIAAGAVLPFGIILYLVSPGARKRLFRDLIALLIVLLPLYLLWRAGPGTFEGLGDFQPQPAPAEELPPVPEVTYTPEPRQWLLLVATVGVALVVTGVAIAVAWALWRRRHRPPTSLDRLADQAEEAIDAIEAGADLEDTVLRCYVQMMEVLREERGLQRQSAMTPREFEARLEEAGVPTSQVRRLTRLFEQVRYGDKRLGKEQERQAVVALTSVVHFCRGAA